MTAADLLTSADRAARAGDFRTARVLFDRACVLRPLATSASMRRADEWLTEQEKNHG